MASDPIEGAPEAPPPPGTAERWAFDLITSATWEAKLDPGPVPRAFEEGARARRIERPGRPPGLRVLARAPRTPRSLASPAARARLLQTFFHHELQAAELFAWAALAFPETPLAFRRGLLAIAGEELGHARLYRDHLAAAGVALGSEPVRDWFWQRVPGVRDATGFTALFGLGLEGGHLEHAEHFAGLLEQAGDRAAARLVRRIGKDEVAHVRFARAWFERWSGPLTFAGWSRSLPAPLTPLVLCRLPLNRAARRAAGLGDAFLDELERSAAAARARASKKSEGAGHETHSGGPP